MPRTKSSYATLTASLLVLWFAFSLTASALHLFRSLTQPPLALGIGAVAPVALFLAWFALSPGFRAYLLSLDLRTLTLVQSWRVIGFTFLVLASYRMLPWLFAAPAGLGDMAMGVTANYAAFSLANPARRGAFIRWQLLGMLDLVTALTLGPVSGILAGPHGLTAGLMTILPLSLIPTFGVPLYLILHIISIAQARRWPVQNERTNIGPSFTTSAA